MGHRGDRSCAFGWYARDALYGSSPSYARGGARRLLKGGFGSSSSSHSTASSTSSRGTSLGHPSSTGGYSSSSAGRWGHASRQPSTTHVRTPRVYTHAYTRGGTVPRGNSYSYYYGARSMPRGQPVLIVRRHHFVCYSCYTHHNYHYDDRGQRCAGHLDCKTAETYLLPTEHDRYELTPSLLLPPDASTRSAVRASSWPLMLLVHDVRVHTMGASFAADGNAGVSPPSLGGDDARSLPVYVTFTTSEISISETISTGLAVLTLAAWASAFCIFNCCM